MKTRSGIVAAMSTLLLGLLAGCDTNSSNQARPIFGRSLGTIWPNEDGRAWNYRIHARQWSDPGPHVYGDRDSVPPIPTMAQIRALLGHQATGTITASDSAAFQLRFNGLMTTGSGVTAQRLQETVTPAAAGAFPRSAFPMAAAGHSGFLRELRRARPDLAPRLGGVLPAASSRASVIGDHPTVFLFGYAWRRTSEWIGSYGDADTALAWKYLTRFLLPGSQFTHRLVPSLAPDVYLHGLILDRQTIVTRDGTFANAVVCLYAVDYGIGTEVDSNNQVVGYYRLYSYGTVAYADRVGPVASYERRFVGVGQPSSLGNTELNLTLTSRTVP